jgi:hypothetical protein
VELEEIASFLANAVETKADKMTGVMLGCNGVCMFNEKENFVENVSLGAERMGKVAWFTTCANMLHERVPGRSHGHGHGHGICL